MHHLKSSIRETMIEGAIKTSIEAMEWVKVIRPRRTWYFAIC
jgi:hypothetical protein